jgi:phosphatidylserine/phosphatidylglycerophosphate/cardiolipin synthase-like enzyme
MKSEGRWGFHQWDDRIGDGLEALLKRHHDRRLRRLGWGEALHPPEGDDCYSSHAKVRPGNSVDVLIDGASAFPAMEAAIRGAQHFVHIANWHASPDFQLSRGDDATTLRDLLAETSARIPVRLLLWAGPPLPAFEPTRRRVKQARAEFMRDSNVQCALDSRERTMHCHHEKIVIVDGTQAFVGGLDFTALQGDRYDDNDHEPRDVLRWHDAAVRLRGPAVVDVARHFCQRWTEIAGEPLPEPLEPEPTGGVDIQVVRTVPERTYEFSPLGDFTILEAYIRALRSAQRFVYLENQFLWSPEIVDVLAAKLKDPPSNDFRILLVLPTKPSDGRDTTRGQLGRLLDADAGSYRLLATTDVGHPGDDAEPVYVHAKIGIVDDQWLTIGSANLNEHSLFNDSELNVVTCDRELARETRLRLWAEHTERERHELEGEPCSVIDNVWRPIAEEQHRRRQLKLPQSHRLTLLPNVSRRVDRLEGPMRGLLVDG